MSPWLKTLAWVAPGAAVARLRALSAIDMIERYQGAETGRRASSFKGRGTSANTALSGRLARLRDRSREQVRDAPYAARTLDILGGHAIGTGIRVEWDTGSDRADRQATAAWEEWCTQSDIERVSDFGGQQLLALRGMLEGGDSVIRMIDLPMGGRRRVPFALQVLEGDLIDESRDGQVERYATRMGVRLGDFDERLGLWLHREHPGEAPRRLPAVGVSPFSSQFVGYDDAIHLYRPLRPGQVRGVPIFAPILMTAQDFADFMDAVVVKARMEACLGLFVEATEGSPRTLAGTKIDDKGKPIEDMRPGMVVYGAPGEKVSPILPASMTQIDPVARAALRGMAVGAGVTYDQMTGDLTQANYSSLRAGKIEFRRLIEQLQWLILVPQMMQRVTNRFVDRAQMAGVLQRRKDGWNRSYVMPAVEPIDPLKDLQADILAVRSGRLSPQEFIAAWGRPWREVLAQHKTFFAATDDLVLDIDPRKVSQAGQAQSFATDSNNARGTGNAA